MDTHPAFCFRHIDRHYDIKGCTPEERAALATTFFTLGQLPWKEIFRADRHGCGFEKIDPENIRRPIPTAVEGRNIIAFRFHGKAPMVGFKDGKVFHVVWLDRDFSLYKH